MSYERAGQQMEQWEGEVAYEHTRRVWKRWLARRNSKNRMSWAGFASKVQQQFRLPATQIVHVF
jgi:hypothetical protein